MACRQLSCQTLVSGLPLLGAMVNGQPAEPQDLQARIAAARLVYVDVCMLFMLSIINTETGPSGCQGSHCISAIHIAAPAEYEAGTCDSGWAAQ